MVPFIESLIRKIRMGEFRAAYRSYKFHRPPIRYRLMIGRIEKKFYLPYKFLNISICVFLKEYI